MTIICFKLPKNQGDKKAILNDQNSFSEKF